MITDLGVLEPDERTKELTLTQLHEGVKVADVLEATGWEVSVSGDVSATEPLTEEELGALRELVSR